MRKCFGGVVALAIAVCLATSAFAQNPQGSPSDVTITKSVQTVVDPSPDYQEPVDPSAVSVVGVGCGGCPGAAVAYSSCCGSIGNDCCPTRRILVRRANRCCTPAVNQCCAAPVTPCCETACATNDCCRRVVARPLFRGNRCCNVATNNCCAVQPVSTGACCQTACTDNCCNRRVVARPMFRNNVCCNVPTTGCCPTTVTMQGTEMGTFTSSPAPMTSGCGTPCVTTSNCCDQTYTSGRIGYQPRILGRLGARRACW